MKKTNNKKYKKELLHKVMSRLYADMRENGNVIFKKLHGKVGTFDWHGDETIEIDYRKDILPTIIHEFLHKWNPEKSESWVIKEESRIINSLSVKQVKNFIRVLAETI